MGKTIDSSYKGKYERVLEWIGRYADLIHIPDAKRALGEYLGYTAEKPRCVTALLEDWDEVERENEKHRREL